MALYLFSNFICTARTCRNHTPQAGRSSRKTSHPNECDVLTVFLWVGFHSQNFPEHPFSLFLRIHLHSQNLPEAYSWMRGKKQTQNQNLPEAYTWMTYKKEEGKPCGVLPFSLTSFSQPGPAGTIHLKQAAKAGKHHTRTNEIQQKKRKTMWRFNCFLSVGFHSQNFPKHQF